MSAPNPLHIAQQLERLGTSRDDRMSLMFTAVAATACGIYIVKELKGLWKDDDRGRYR